MAGFERLGTDKVEKVDSEFAEEVELVRMFVLLYNLYVVTRQIETGELEHTFKVNVGLVRMYVGGVLLHNCTTCDTTN